MVVFMYLCTRYVKIYVMKVIDRNIKVEERVYCPWYNGDGYDGTTPVSKCKDCSFFGNIEEGTKKVNCYYDSKLINKHFHVTELTCDGKTYHVRNPKDMTKEQSKKFVDNDYESCDFCAFSVDLPNDNGYCALRMGSSGNLTPFICYEGEYWEEVKQ